MAETEPITQWIDGLREGDEESVRRIWDSFFHRMIAIARHRMRTARRTACDEEDIVVSAFKSFCAGVQRGKFPRLQDRDDLWRLLLVITARKVADQIQFQQRDKRDVRSELSSNELTHSSLHGQHEWFVSREPSPEFAAECSDQLRALLEQLQLEDLKRIALLKMEGYTNQDIARELDRSLATIERKLKTIREIWSQSCR